MHKTICQYSSLQWSGETQTKAKGLAAAHKHRTVGPLFTSGLLHLIRFLVSSIQCLTTGNPRCIPGTTHNNPITPIFTLINSLTKK